MLNHDYPDKETDTTSARFLRNQLETNLSKILTKRGVFRHNFDQYLKLQKIEDFDMTSIASEYELLTLKTHRDI
jgi:hypothetical protein